MDAAAAPPPPRLPGSLPQPPVLDDVRGTARAHDGMPQQVDDDDYSQDETVAEVAVVVLPSEEEAVTVGCSAPSPQPAMDSNDDDAGALAEMS